MLPNDFGPNNPDDPLDGFDKDPLDGFDDAVSVIPLGQYDCRLECGELTTTKTGKPAYRLRFAVADGPFKSFVLWRWLMLDNPASMARAKAALEPLGLKTAADLRKPFPGLGREIICKVFVTVEPWQGTDRNGIEQFVVTSDRMTGDERFGFDEPTGGPR